MPQLKRNYRTDSTVSHVDVQRETKIGAEWHPSTRLVESALADGWMSIADGKLTLKTASGKPDHVFKILNGPGVFCCHDNVKLDAGGDTALAYIAEHHADADGKPKKSPDPENPAGYRVDNFYRLKRVK